MASVSAQEPRGNRLIDQEPYDIVTLNAANEGKVLKVFPLDLPGRKLPANPKSSDKLRLRLIEDGQEYEVAWYDMEKVELFEQLIVAETNKFSAEGKFDAAYDNLQFLLDFYPEVQGLAEARQFFLYQSAGAAFKAQKYDDALAVLEELLAQNPDYRAGESSPTLLQVLGSIADRILARYVEDRDYRSARTLLARLTSQYKANKEPFAERWQKQLIDLATSHRDAAREYLQAGRFVEAFDASILMQQVWPDLPGAAELASQIAERYPIVRVGVDHPALVFDSLSLHDAAARRAGRLQERLLMEFSDLGPEGGVYSSPLGAITHSEDGLALRFRLAASSADAGLQRYDLVQFLLRRAQPDQPGFLPQWSRVVDSIRTAGSLEVRVDLAAGHVLPEALLRVPVGQVAAAAAEPAQPYTVLSQEGDRARFTRNANYIFARPGQPAEVVERHYADPQRALLALERGEIDVLERVFPGDIAALAKRDDVAVAAYKAPTTHVLVIRSEHPYLANRTFRRALLYGSNRELILREGLLRGANLPGFRVVSGPFPAPSSSGDLPAYGYDERIEPRQFDPRLGLTLRLLAEGEIKSAHQKAEQQVPSFTPLVLGHPADEVSRIGCQALARQWKKIGIACELVEFPPGVFDDANDKCDLVYLQLAAWEPVADASRLLGETGLAPASSAFVQLTLRQLERATNWQTARDRLIDLHRLVHEDVTLLPLWQTMDHYAYRRGLPALDQTRVRLYQDIEQWRSEPQLAGRSP